MTRKLQNEFNFTSAQLQQMFNLPHQVALEPYVKGFQYKVLNFILYTNTKLYKIGYSTDDKTKCTFCKLERQTLYHLFSCPHSQTFWKCFETLWFSSVKLQTFTFEIAEGTRFFQTLLVLNLRFLLNIK